MADTRHSVRVRHDDDKDEFVQLRESIRMHWAMVSSHGKHPLDGLTWGPEADRYDSLLNAAAQRAGLADLPALPWTSRQRHEVDERCRAVGVVSGPPLLRAAGWSDGAGTPT